MDLECILKNRSEGSDLFYISEMIKREAIPILGSIKVYFPEYTAHDISHSELVLKRINELIPDALKQDLKAYEIYFLIVSAYLHDLGMVYINSSSIPNKIISDFEKKKKYIRDNHHIRSEDYIVENYKLLKIPDIQQARIIGRICRGHRKESLNNIKKFDPKQTYKNQIINIPMLASVLRLGDELDLTFERIQLILYELGLITDQISKSEWEKHLDVDGIARDPGDSLVLRSTATCKKPQIHRALKEIEHKVNDQLSDLHNHLYHYRHYSRDFPRRFDLIIKTEGYKYYDFKFSLNENEILKLLIGEGLYKGKEECIRELLKNSLDACKLNAVIMEDAIESGFIYEPKIDFRLSPENDKLTINDNGAGMDEYIIENYFTKIGRSFYRSPDFLERGYSFSPVSELGIGFLSCFMIASKAVIETKSNGSDSLFIQIDNISNYFLVQDGTRKYPGTSITLYLKGNIKKINIKEELEYFARHLAIPIGVRLASNEEYVVKSKGKNYEPFFRIGDLENRLHILGEEMRSKYFTCMMGILLEKSENKLSLIGSSRYIDRRLYNNIISRGSTVISNNGILINDNFNALIWLNADKIFLDINVEGNYLDLNLGRNDIIKNNRFDIFTRLLEKEIIKAFISLISRLDIHDGIEMNDFISYITKDEMMAKYYFSKEAANKEKELIEKDKLLSKFFIKYYSFKCFSKDGFSLKKYDEIQKLKIKLINCWDYNDNYISDILAKCDGFNGNYLYVMLEDHGLIDLLIRHLTKCNDSINYYDMFEMILESDLNEILPSEVNIVNMHNYNTDVLITYILEGDEGFQLFVNNKNRFITLIRKYKDKIYKDNPNLLKELFRYIKWENGPDIKRVLHEQEIILNWLKNSKLIEENEFEYYRLTKDDLEGSIL